MTRRCRDDPGHALILGSTGGIGEALVQRLASDGWELTLTCRDSNRAAEAFASLAGVRNLLSCDLAERTSVADLADRLMVEHRRRRFNAIVINAGVVDPRPTLDAGFEEMVGTYFVNVLGPLQAVRPLLAEMVQGEGGRLVANVSTAAFFPLTNYGSYCGSKAALRAQLLALRAELSPKVAVTGVYLSGIRTRQLELENSSPYGSPLNYLSRPKEPEQAAETIAGVLTSRRNVAEVYSPRADALAARAMSSAPNFARPIVRFGERVGRHRQRRDRFSG